MAWPEVSEDGDSWEIPAERMKARKPHAVPLTLMSAKILADMKEISGNGALVFPGQRVGKPMSDMTLAAVLKRMDQDCTVHGFRSTFRDWAAECSDASWEAVERSLAHSVGDATVQAYFRSDLMEKRRALLEQWADYCYSQVTDA